MDLQLSGKTALVTGSTAGIGLAIARRLSEEGATVWICGRNQEKLDVAAQDIGASVRTVLADPATTEGSETLAATIQSVDILVNNLGVYASRDFDGLTDDEWRSIFEINVLSGVRLSRAFLPGMRERNFGRIIFISSDASLVVPPDMIHYSMTKSAQLAVSRGLAASLKGTAVTVNAVLAGSTRSEGIGDFLASVVPEAKNDEERERIYFERERPTSIIQRLIEPSEIAHAVAYLASPLASATTGAAVRVDGGIVPTIA
jgi:NAD(P)-dependent dehydrogenase (short-subunit alcohol dehydrogenase family)